MRKGLYFVLFLVSLVGSSGQARATTPRDITIAQHTSRGCVTPCVFAATGALTDSGTVTLDAEHDSAIPSPVVGTAHFVRTLHGQLGTLTIQLNTLLTPTDVPWLLHEQGRWVLVDATGAYAGLQGEGEESGTRDFRLMRLDVVYTGQVH